MKSADWIPITSTRTKRLARKGCPNPRFDRFVINTQSVNRRRNGTPYRLPKGTPASGCIGSARVGPELSISAGACGRGLFVFSALALRAVFKAPGFVSGFHDLAMVGEPVEQSGGHFGIAEYGWPLAEGQVRRDDDRCPLIEPADEMEEELAAGLSKWEIAQFVHDDEVESGDEVGQPPLLSAACLRFEPIDEVDDVEEASACAVAD